MWCTVLMGMGALEMTSTAIGRAQTNEEAGLPPNTCELTSRKHVGEEGHERPDLGGLFKNTAIGTDWGNMCSSVTDLQKVMTVLAEELVGLPTLR